MTEFGYEGNEKNDPASEESEKGDDMQLPPSGVCRY